MNKMPKGCDQQGRYPEAAESSTELGMQDEGPPAWYDAALVDVAIAVSIICAISVIIYFALGY